ncbi:MAG: MutS-related protein [Bacteroidales bacterium]
MNFPESVYKQRIGEFTSGIGHWRKPLRWIPWMRLSLFISTGFLIYYSFKFPGIAFMVAALISFTGFLFAGWLDSDLKKKIRRLENLIRINEQEITALGGNFSGFESGSAFINQDHPYTHDLDIFGKGSLYQHVNRTATIFGRERLADYFSDAFQYRDEIRQRQQAVAELSVAVDFRQQLQLIFLESDTSAGDLQALNGWLNNQDGIKRIKAVKFLSFMLPAMTIGLITLSIAGLLPYQLAIIMVLLQMLVVFAFGRRTQLVHQAVTSQDKILRKYAMAFSLIEATPFTTEFNQKLQNSLRSSSQGMPGKVIKRLSLLLNMMDSNLNILVSVIMNGLFMFNIHVLIAVEKWRLTYRDQVPVWFEGLAELDALSSLGTYAFNHPLYTYPEAVTGGFQFVAEGLGHPLIPTETCVVNDVEIAGWKQFRIITGANMSGKSTFLRTVGANLLLAMMGAPVFAKKLTFFPVEIHSSIRTNDSLARRESYFYAELRRLKEIITDLEKGKKKFILLDEILKGTNSSDKQTGSIALIRQLMKYDLAGLFATHDLALGELMNHYPENIRNLCFEIHITGEKMEIDYKLSPGICRNLNASFLMKNMGIILEEDAHI